MKEEEEVQEGIMIDFKKYVVSIIIGNYWVGYRKRENHVLENNNAIGMIVARKNPSA
jgi:hypothetical protein